jgi:hypothetical protein
MNRPQSQRDILRELIRRGLPADYAHRAASELADHHRDLIDALRRDGLSEAQASSEASLRLGDPRMLVKKTVREYQRRHWWGRWRLVTFLLAPLPVLIAAWIVTLYALQFASGRYVLWTGIATDGIRDPHRFAPLWMKYACLISAFVLVPAVITYVFAKLANRAALGWSWVIVIGCILGLAAGTFQIVRAGYGAKVLAYDRPGGQPLAQQPSFFIDNPFLRAILGQPSHVRRWFARNFLQTCQLLLPLAVAVGVVLRNRQLAMRSQRLLLDGG